MLERWQVAGSERSCSGQAPHLGQCSGGALFCAQDLEISVLQSRQRSDAAGLFSFTLQRGCLTALVGRNGSGKSTLLRALAGLIRPASGSLKYGGRELSFMGAEERARSIAWCPELIHMPFDYLAQDYVALGLYPRSGEKPWSSDEIKSFMACLGASHLMQRRTSELSSGERRKLALLRTFITQAPTVLLDEPTAHLDLAACLEFFNYLKDLQKQGVSIICVLHHLAYIERYCDEVMVLDRCGLALQGPTSEVLKSPDFSKILGVSP